MSEEGGFMAIGPDGPKYFSTQAEAIEFFQNIGKTVEGNHVRVAHEIEQFLESLDEQQISAFKTVVGAAIDAPAYGHEVIGRLIQLRTSKFGYCVGCGKNHEQELQKMMTEMEGGVSGVEPELNEKIREHLDNTPPVVYDPRDAYNKPVKSGPSPKMQLLEEYGLNIITQNDPHEIFFACKNCGLRYPSLEDRMLKEPGIGGCDGCINKTKFG